MMLKSRIRERDKADVIFARNQCKTLLKCYRKKWDYDINQLLTGEAYDDIDNILHELKDA